ncbi:MAG: preprotein translocase subunit YajC [Acidobacteriota bacterium]
MDGFMWTAMLKAPSVQGASPGSGGWLQMVPFALMALIFYFLLFAPERRRKKQLADMLANLKNGDMVVTTGGIHARVVGVTDQILQLRIADGVKIEVSRSAITSKIGN